MSVELEVGLPSTRYIQTYIKQKNRVEIKLSTGDSLTGTIQWQDPSCICLISSQNTTVIIWRQSIVYIQPQ
jgi:host factor-I protein